MNHWRVSRVRRSTALVALGAILVGITPGAASAQTDPMKVDFNRDIRPILSDKCFACHGPDEAAREADLRLDLREHVAPGDGKGVIVPGKPTESELVRRITAADPDDRMPPEDAPRKLTEREIALLTKWVEQGATYEGHWAFAAPRAIEPPEARSVELRNWPRNDIDRFILARLEAAGFAPAPEADRRTLIRRLSFDLTGLPPTAAEVEAFIDDGRPDAYERLVERLLESPAYGERMAAWWLDLVRYADTVGYHGDQDVSVWPFREYVINAFNANMPFDRFTIEQLAGDLLPDATIPQRIASGYNRLNMMTAEGGAQDKEYLAKYAADRVRTTSTVWMGATLGCAECHDHKFDPFTAKDFYSFAAFFADIEEKGFYGGANATGAWGPQLFLPTPEQTARIADLTGSIDATRNELVCLMPDLDERAAAWEESLKKPERDKLPAALAAALKPKAEARDEAQLDTIRGHVFALEFGEYKERADALVTLHVDRKVVQDAIASTLVTQQRDEPRVMRVLPRGNWMDDSGPIVTPAVPAFLAHGMPVDADEAAKRQTRLDLARWITSPRNPLTGRVLVNRLWAMCFGSGLSKRLDDLGAQGDWPSHPELLDYLALYVIDQGWDIKATLRLIVTSAAYKQSSMPRPELAEHDPYNRLLGRQSRWRLDAEMVRDNALAVSGLLVEKVGGPSVKPYQPPKYYDQLNFPKREYVADKGDGLYRRGLYMHWQRTFLHPMLLAFDAPSREECTAERTRSNTPVQSLVMLNDPQYVEAARVFAARIMREGGESTADRIAWAFSNAVHRDPAAAEAAVLAPLFTRHFKHYSREKSDAEALLSVGDTPADAALDAGELAAWTSVARTIFNLHEFITRD